MANENKNIHELAAESDEDTSELRILPEPAAEDPDLDYEFEADAATHSFENLDRKRQDESLATLQLELRDRVGAIDQLEYEIEKLRERCIGLETELKAREDATGNLLTELADACKSLTGARERLERRDEKVARLEAQVHEQEERLAETARALDDARRSAESWEAARVDLERRRQEADSRIASLSAEAERERAAHARAREAEQSATRARRDIEQQNAEARSLLETLRQYIEGRKTQWEQQEVLLRSKDALLEELQHKLGQYARETGEQRARLRAGQASNEELTRNLDDERRAREQAEAALAGRERELEALHGELDALGPVAADKDVLAARLEELTSELASEQAGRDVLEARLAAVEEELAALHATHEALQRSAAEHEETAAFRLVEIDSLATQLAELSHEHDRERNDRQSLEAQCNALEEQTERLRAEATAAREQADLARPAARDRERLSGVVIGQREELRELSERLARNEAYADTLRRKLAGHATESVTNAAARHDLQSALDAARAQIAEVSAELDAGRRRESGLADEREEDRRRYEEELEKLRLALTAAEEAAAENQDLNEQLASDLVETSSFRVALESQLSAADKTLRKQSKELNRELKKLRQQVEDYERKISSKDAAISVLLAELANKPQAPAAAEGEPVVHHLAERRAPGPEERTATAQEKDRLARLLIGTVDGQEVRFPLFKNKLTIGRTANNDIQLKAQYISRRHAVVVCDRDSTRIVDWGSKNGIYVNGVRVSEKILRSGDQLTVGTAEFRFEERPKR